MEDKNKNKDIKTDSNRPKMVTVEWGRSLNNSDKNVDLKAQNNMGDITNKYAHITQPNNPRDGVVNDLSDVKIINRGNNNLAPQMDLELGKRSITHRKIAEGIAGLVAGNGLAFVPTAPTEDGQLTADQQLDMEIAKGWLDIGLNDAIPVLANGAVYFSLSPLYIRQSPPAIRKGTNIVNPTPLFFNAVPSQQIRFGVPYINDLGRQITPIHAYHQNWGFTGQNCDDAAPILDIIPIASYIEKSNAGEIEMPSVENPRALPPAFWIKTMQSDQSKLQPFVSHAIVSSVGIFDNAYPLPEWKSDTSINYIQGEVESSNVCIDFLRNGLHIFAVVNVYGTKFNSTIAPDKSGNVSKDWADNLEVVQSLRKSHNSGKILVNPVYTSDAEKDGLIEIVDLKLTFPVDAVRFFNEESRASILTAWGVMADLFGISKPEKNNLRSQEGFLSLGIVLLQEKVSAKQHAIEKGINEILDYYGVTEVRARIKAKDSNAYLVVMKEFASQYMNFNEVRTNVLRLSAYTSEEIDKLAEETSKLSGKLQSMGAVIVPPVQDPNQNN
jgi:hypothetical protein